MDWQVLTGGRLADAAAGGLIVLAAGSLAARLCRQPVRRARLIVLSLLGAMAVPALGALPVAPRWSAGLPAAPAAILARADHAAPAEAGSRPRPPGATGSRVALGPIEQPGGMPTGHARTGPALAPSGPVASAPAARWHLPSARTVLLGELFRGGGRVRGLVARRSAPALARDPVGSTGPGGDPRRLPRARRPRGRAGRAARERPDRLPFTYTWRRPVILLPSTLCDGSEPGALRYVLAHEWSHVERRDAWAWNLACLAGLVLFYQPLFWWLRRQLRLCQDYLADDRAAAAGSAEDYAAFLVRLARVRRSAPAVPALGIGDRRSNLYRRVVMLVQDHEPLERRCRAAWSLSAATAAAVVIVVASGLRLGAAPPAADDPAKGAQAVKDAARPPGDAKKDAGRDAALHGDGRGQGHRQADRRGHGGRPPLDPPTSVGEPGAPGDPPHHRRRRHVRLHDPPGSVCHALPLHRAGRGAPRLRPAGRVRLRPEHDPEEREAQRAAVLRDGSRCARPSRSPGGSRRPRASRRRGCVVLAYSRTDKAGGTFEYGSFARAETDAQGRFRLPITTPGQAAYWVLPKDYAHR